MKKRHTGLAVFLVILAVLIAVPAAFYIYLLNSPLEIDDILSIPQRPTLSADDRFKVSASADTMDIRLNKSDTAWLVLDIIDLNEVRAGLEENGIAFDRFGLTVDDGFVILEFNGKWNGFLPLPVRVCLSPQCEGPELKLKMEKISLGRKLKLGGSVVRFIGEVAEVTADMTAYSSVFSDMVAADTANDIFTITVAKPLKWLTAETAGALRMEYWNDYLGVDLIEQIASAVENGDEEACGKFLLDLENDPASIPELKKQQLVYASNIAVKQFFLDEKGEMFNRLFPTLDEDSVRTQTDEKNRLVAERRRQLCDLANEIAVLYCKKGIATDGKQFYNLKAGKEPLSAAQFAAAAEVSEWLDISGIRFVFGHVSNTYIDDALALRKMPVIGKHAFDGIDETQVYIPYMLFISLAERPVMAYEHAPGNVNLYDISRERYESLISSEYIPFVDQRYAPT
ncbi:MAG: hypothetical protein IJJ22_01210 [Oscillospiraceae bacterium]|nr:hypothetical protein [Oscillospiraceae bacterium]